MKVKRYVYAYAQHILMISLALAIMVAVALSLTGSPTVAAGQTWDENYVLASWMQRAGFKPDTFVSNMEANKERYLGTPYSSSPRTLPGVAMDCSGFVAVALEEQGGMNLDAFNREPVGGAPDKYLTTRYWQLLAQRMNGGTYAFNTVEELLSSGVATKGDIILLTPFYDYRDNTGSTDPNDGKIAHIGFFWGETPSDNKFWNSGHPNQIGPIEAKSPSVIVYLIKMPPSNGSIQLTKKSSAPEITDQNANYSLAGAEYAIFSDPSLAGKYNVGTLTTNEQGVSNEVTGLTSGTYYVREITAPKGYTLDPNTYTVEVLPSEKSLVNGSSGVLDKPIVSTIDVLVRKHDSELKFTYEKNQPQGAASLEKAHFKLAYYDGFYDENNLPQNPTKSWTVQTDSSGIVKLNSPTETFTALDGTEHPYVVSGDDFFTNKDGTIVIPLGTLAITEIKAPKGYRLPSSNPTYIRHIDSGIPLQKVSGGFDAPIVAEDVIRGGISLVKLDRETKGQTSQGDASLAGATFDVINKNSQSVIVSGKRVKPGGVALTLTTDKSGAAISKSNALPYGTYEIVEASAPKGYVHDGNYKQTVTISEHNIVVPVSANPTNNVLRGGVEAAKYDLETGTTNAQGNGSLDGAVFTIANKSKHSIMYAGKKFEPGQDILSISTNGAVAKTQAHDLPYGTYEIREVQPPQGYTLSNWTETFEIRKAGLISLSQEKSPHNRIIRGDIALMKYGEHSLNPDEDPELKTPFEGASFRVINASQKPVLGPDNKIVEPGKLVTIITTDSDGYATTEGLYEGGALPFGTYEIQEVPETTPQGYKTAEPFEVTVSESNRVYRFILEDKTGTALKLVKVDSESGKQIPLPMSFKILDSQNKEVEFTLPYPSNQTISEFTTNLDGTALLPGKLLAGTYQLVETKAPHGYVLNSTPHTFTIDGSTVSTFDNPLEIDLANVPQKGKISITKSDSITGEPITENPASFDIVANSDITTPDGTLHAKAGDLIETLTTNEYGVATSTELYLGSYRVVETSQPQGYVLTESNTHLVDLVYAGQQIEVQNTEIEIGNVPHSFSLYKYDAINPEKPLPEATFSLWRVGNPDEDYDKTEFQVPEDVEITELTTDDRGILELKNLEEGRYRLLETSAPDSYYINPSTPWITLVVDRHGYINSEINHEVSLENKPTEIQIHKRDLRTAEILPGAELEIRDESGAVVQQWTSDTNPHTIFGLAPGLYTLIETQAPDGYLQAEPLEFNVSHNDQPTIVELLNSRIPAIGTVAYDGFTGEKTVRTNAEVNIIDRVDYKNLHPGQEYLVIGTLMDKKTQSPLLVDEVPVTAQVTFSPVEPDGYIETEFIFNASHIDHGTELVVFEELYSNGELIAAHRDIDDANQTVTIINPSLKTQARDKQDGNQAIIPESNIVITDTVTYTGLTPHQSYEIEGVLMDKKSKKPLVIDGHEVRSRMAFVPEEANGKIELNFILDGTGLRHGQKLVVFETLYQDGKEYISHHDFNDKEQTITVVPPLIEKLPVTGDRVGLYALIGVLGLFFTTIGIYVVKGRLGCRLP